jgi:hypothetical protein
VRALAAELDAWLAAARAAGAGAAPSAPVPEALRQQLRALGYVE